MQTAKEGANLLSQPNDSNIINFTRRHSSANGEFPLAQEQIKTDFSEIIAENFGANAKYVETLLARWRSNPALVDESWRAYFEELIGPNGGGAKAAKTETATTPQAAGDGAAAAKTAAKRSEPPAERGPRSGSPAGVQDAGGPAPRTEALPIRGAALKIVE